MKQFNILYIIIFTIFFGVTHGETDIYIYTDFGGGRNQKNECITDWQTAIELSSEGWKLTQHSIVYINDAAIPLNPKEAGNQLAATFPYLGNLKEKINRIVIHVIDPGVGNTSTHPRALVLRKDGTLFIGPDNGTLSLACPPHSIAAIYEINSKYIHKLTGIDVEVGGTFHGRDLFAVSAYLIAANKVSLEEIGKKYSNQELKFRNLDTNYSHPIKFNKVSTTHWNIPLKSISKNDLFEKAYFLAIVQSPFFVDKIAPQLFFIDSNENNAIAIYNKKTNNLYVGPNNGIGTSFFKEFSLEDISAYSLKPSTYFKIRETSNTHEILELVHRENPIKKLEFIELLPTILKLNDKECILQGRIWIDAYGNIKTTVDSDTLNKFIKEGYNHFEIILNNVSKEVKFAESFGKVPSGEAFIYIGSSGTIGPNPQRSRRYIEVSCNGSKGIFGKDLFSYKNDTPKTGQEILFKLTKK